jgi:hypothetical protein
MEPHIARCSACEARFLGQQALAWHVWAAHPHWVLKAQVAQDESVRVVAQPGDGAANPRDGW